MISQSEGLLCPDLWGFTKRQANRQGCEVQGVAMVEFGSRRLVGRERLYRDGTARLQTGRAPACRAGKGLTEAGRVALGQ